MVVYLPCQAAAHAGFSNEKALLTCSGPSAHAAVLPAARASAPNAVPADNTPAAMANRLMAARRLNVRSSAPSAPITPTRLMAITSTGVDRPVWAGAAIGRSWIAGASQARPGGIWLESCWNAACGDRLERQQNRWWNGGKPWPG